MVAGADYGVHLKENEIYNEMLMKENMVYPKNIFEGLSVIFNAEFTGSEEINSDITADYVIEVKVKGFLLRNNEERIVYEKAFPITAQTGLKFSKKASITEEVHMDFTQYEDYINHVNSIINAEPNSETELVFTGNFKAETEFGDKEEPFTYTIVLPLFENLFTIDKPQSIKTTGSITDTKTKEIVTDRYLLIIPGAVIFIMLLLIAYIMLYTTSPTEYENNVLRFKSIKRKYGSRIVKVSNFTDYVWENTMEIKDIEGMIKISDEYNIPIFYVQGDNGMPVENRMFIPGKDICYIYYIMGPDNSIFSHTTT